MAKRNKKKKVRKYMAKQYKTTQKSNNSGQITNTEQTTKQTPKIVETETKEIKQPTTETGKTKSSKNLLKTETGKATAVLFGVAASLLLTITVGVIGSDRESSPKENELEIPVLEVDKQNDSVNKDIEKDEDIEKETNSVTISLNLYKIPNKNEIEMVLKNASKEKAVYNFSAKDIYTYRILNESGKTVKMGTFGKLESKDITLLEDEEHSVRFDYDSIYKELAKGYYTLKVTINNELLKGTTASTTFTVSDFDTTVTSLKEDEVVIRSVNYDKNILQGVVSGINLIEFKFDDSLEPDLKKYKAEQDVVRMAYLNDKGVYHIQAVGATNEATKLVETPTEEIVPKETSEEIPKETPKSDTVSNQLELSKTTNDSTNKE